MAIVSFEEIIALVDRLSPLEQTRLTAYLLESAQKRQLSATENLSLVRSAQIDVEVVEEPSVRRVDWYEIEGEPDNRTLEEVFASVEQNRWTPPPGSPAPSEMIREDRGTH